MSTVFRCSTGMHSCSTGMQYLRGPSFDLLQAPSAKLEDLPTVLATRAAGKMRWALCFEPLLIVLSLMLASRCDNCMLILLAWPYFSTHNRQLFVLKAGYDNDKEVEVFPYSLAQGASLRTAHYYYYYYYYYSYYYSYYYY